MLCILSHAGHLYISGETFLQVFCPSFELGYLLVVEFFIYSGQQILIRYMICKYLLPFCRLFFHFFDSVL